MSAPRVTRGYSRAFPSSPRAARKQFNFDDVPPALHRAVRAKAKRDGVSLRALVFAYLATWADVPANPEPTKGSK